MTPVKGDLAIAYRDVGTPIYEYNDTRDLWFNTGAASSLADGAWLGGSQWYFGTEDPNTVKWNDPYGARLTPYHSMYLQSDGKVW